MEKTQLDIMLKLNLIILRLIYYPTPQKISQKNVRIAEYV